MSKEKNYGIANEFATELLQRIMNKEISIEDALHIIVSTPSFILYRTLPEDVVDESLEKHSELINQLGELITNYTKDNKMLKHEYIACLTSVIECGIMPLINK